MKRPPPVVLLTSAALVLAATGCDAPDPTSLESGGVNAARAVIAGELYYGHPGRITFLDSEDDWDVLLLGYDPADDYACNDGVFVGGILIREHLAITQPEPSFDLGDGDTWGMGEGFHDLVTTIGRPPLYMYSRASFPPDDATDEEWCAYLTNDWMAAGGWSATFASDNDVTGGDGTPGINSWGGTEAGELVGVDGTRYRYEWKYRALYDPENGFKLLHLVDHVVRIGN